MVVDAASLPALPLTLGGLRECFSVPGVAA